MLIFINKQGNHILNFNNRTNFRNVNRKTAFFTEHLRWMLLDARPKLDVYDIHVIPVSYLCPGYIVHPLVRLSL